MTDNEHKFVDKDEHVLLFNLKGRSPNLHKTHRYGLNVAFRTRHSWWERKRKQISQGRWNGVSPNMFREQQWYNYVEQHVGRQELARYHPKACLNIPFIDSYLSLKSEGPISIYQFAIGLLIACGFNPRERTFDASSAVATWDFSYEGQFSRLEPENDHSSTDTKGPWLQLRFDTETGISVIRVSPSYAASLEPDKLVFLSRPVPTTPTIRVYQISRAANPVSVSCFGFRSTKAFLDLVRNDLLRATLFYLADDPSRPLLAIRSMNRPLLWIPMAQGFSPTYLTAA
jgi:hypothetical protein